MLCAHCFCLWKKKEAVGGVYNIGSRQLVTIAELAQQVIKQCNSSSGIDFVPYELAYAEGFEDMRRRKPSTDKIHALTGWQPEKSLVEIIDDVIAFERSRS